MKFNPGDEVRREPNDYDLHLKHGIVLEVYRSKSPGSKGRRLRIKGVNGEIWDCFADVFKLIKRIKTNA